MKGPKGVSAIPETLVDQAIGMKETPAAFHPRTVSSILSV